MSGVALGAYFTVGISHAVVSVTPSCQSRLRISHGLVSITKRTSTTIKDDDGIEVYLKPVGKDAERLRYAELEDVVSFNTAVRSRKCHFLIER